MLRDELVSVILLICIKFGIYVMMVAQTSQFYPEVSKFDAELIKILCFCTINQTLALTFFFWKEMWAVNYCPKKKAVELNLHCTKVR